MPAAAAGERGTALLVVMWVILVLSLMIGGFAFTMHVETAVASFGRKELKAEMLARSGIELARWVMREDTRSSGTAGGLDGLNQDLFTNQTLFVNHALGEGTINVKIVDEERKLPINRATAGQLRRLFELLAVDPADADVIVDSILDWIDANDLHQLNGAESDYYENLSPAYRAKNAPLDRVEELLLVRGMTPEIFGGHPAGDEGEEAAPALSELLTASSTGRVNVNTAPPLVLQAALGLDDAQVELVVSRRNGGDGVAGTEDDQPFTSAAEFLSLLGNIDPALRTQLDQLLTVSSSVFTVHATGEVAGVKRRISAVIRRNGNETAVLTWREERGGP